MKMIKKSKGKKMEHIGIKELSKIALVLEKKYGNRLKISILINSEHGYKSKEYRNMLYCCKQSSDIDERSVWLQNYKTNQSFYKAVDKLFEPNFIQLKKLCVDSFDIDLYLDKQEVVKVKSILSKEIALLTDDRKVEINRLFMKES